MTTNDPTAAEAEQALAELNQAVADYEQALAQAMARGRDVLLSLSWIPYFFKVDGKPRVAMRYLREQHTKFKAKRDETGFVNHVTDAVVIPNQATIEKALNGPIEPRYIGYLILNGLNCNPNLGRRTY